MVERIEFTPEQAKIIEERLSFEIPELAKYTHTRKEIERRDNENAKLYTKFYQIPADEWKEELGTTGCDYFDYVYLYEFIKKNKPQYFLECGSGVSTLVIANAMKQQCYDYYNGDIKFVSMEQNEKWHKRVVDIAPDFDFCEYICSPVVEARTAFVAGLMYANTPNYPYDVVFVDGPVQSDMCNLDFFGVLLRNKKQATAIVDLRLFSSFFYYMFFGPNQMKRIGQKLYVIGPVSISSWDLDYNLNSLSVVKMEEIGLRMYNILDKNIKTEPMFK